jgi:sterol 14-demethylase
MTTGAAMPAGAPGPGERGAGGTSRPRAAAAPPRLSGALPLAGHMLAFARDPVALMRRVRAECGAAGELRLLNKRVVLLSGPEAQEVFCRAPDEQLSQKIAYRLMTPIFGEGVVFDAPPDRLNEQLRILMPALRDRNMRTYAGVFVHEVGGMVGAWGDAGEIDLLDFTAELTTYTSSHCLLGAEFRHGMNEEFARVYAALERGVNAIAYVNPYLPLPVFRRRDRARARLVEMITEIVARRRAEGARRDDALQVLMDARYADGAALTPNEITGILTAAMFAGHHTSSGTAAWTLIELLRHPEWLARVRDEVDRLHGGDAPVTYQSLREAPVLERAIMEVLRLHPPLVILMRGVLRDLEVAGYTVPAGRLVAISPAVSHAIPEVFADPERFDPDRYAPGRAEDATPFGWIPFGGGHHRCSGAAFAMMQLKAIAICLLRDWTFALVDPPASYRPDYTKLVVQPRHPCRVRYRRRAARAVARGAAGRETAAAAGRATAVTAGTAAARAAPGLPATGAAPAKAAAQPASAGAAAAGTGRLRVAVDLALCQGHAVCMSEAPDVFRVDAGAGKVTVLRAGPPAALRAKLDLAARHCPTRAITIEEE